MTTKTLTSLAMLKVNIDDGGDYLDYLRPFVLQVLVDQILDPVTDQAVRDGIRSRFGLEIPARTVQIVLRRLSKSHLLKREHGVYHIVRSLPTPEIDRKKSEAERHISAVISGLIQFSSQGAKSISHESAAVNATMAFLAEFDISCLRAYLRGTAIPHLEGDHRTDIVLVSEYVTYLQRSDPERFESFSIMVRGHMLANALLCPDLQGALKSSNYRRTTFYLDTPLLVRLLGVEGSAKEDTVKELIALLQRLKGRIATFSHSRRELEDVIRGAAVKIDRPNGRGAIVAEARRRGTTKSDLLFLAGRIDTRLTEAAIEVESTPVYLKQFQIDETAFENILDDEVSYYNSRAREYDINSVRSIYVLRKNTQSLSVENSGAILVTSNSAFSRAAWNYGKQYEVSREVSSVITDFSLANMAWLKAPMGAPSLPMTEILAFSYAALQPSPELLDKFLMEIDKLKEQGGITERDHQLLRSDYQAHDELMNLTLGEEAALTEETVPEILRRVSGEIKEEEAEKTAAAVKEGLRIQDERDVLLEQKKKVQERLYWQSHRQSVIATNVMTGIVIILLVAGFVSGLGFQPTQPFYGWVLTLGSGLLGLLGLGNILVGHTVKSAHQSVHKWLRVRFLKRHATAIGIDPDEFSSGR